MKKLFFIAMLILVGNSINAQSNKGLCKVEVSDVSKATSFGYLLGYSVTFKNNSKKTVDGIYWNVYYYNNANELIEAIFIFRSIAGGECFYWPPTKEGCGN